MSVTSPPVVGTRLGVTLVMEGPPYEMLLDAIRLRTETVTSAEPTLLGAVQVSVVCGTSAVTLVQGRPPTLTVASPVTPKSLPVMVMTPPAEVRLAGVTPLMAGAVRFRVTGLLSCWPAET